MPTPPVVWALRSSNARLTGAFAARYQDDLSALVVDLPERSSHLIASNSTGTLPSRRRSPVVALRLVVAAVIVLGVITHAFFFLAAFWPLFLAAFFALRIRPRRPLRR